MKYTVYKTTNTLNGMIYVGTHKTADLDDGYMGSGKYLRRAMDKYGEENFTKEYLHIFDNSEEMFNMEATVVNEDFVNDTNTYNLKEGGHGGFDYLNKTGKNIYKNHKAQAIENIKAALPVHLDKLKNDSEYRKSYSQKVSEGQKEYYKHNPGTFTGLSHTEETKQTIGAKNSIHQSGSGNSQHGTMWITDGTNNKKIKKTDSIPNGWEKGRKIQNK